MRAIKIVVKKYQCVSSSGNNKPTCTLQYAHHELAHKTGFTFENGTNVLDEHFGFL